WTRRAAAARRPRRPARRPAAAHGERRGSPRAESTLRRMAIEGKDTTDLSVAPVVGRDDPRRFTDSGIEVQPLYANDDLPADLDLRGPGEFPFTRGIHGEMYRRRL